LFLPCVGPPATLLEGQPERTISQILADLRRDAANLSTTTGVRVDTHRTERLYNLRAGFEPTSGDRRRWIR